MARPGLRAYSDGMNAPLHRELPAGSLDAALALDQVTRQWDSDILRQLTDYIAIPAKSPGFDKDWAAHGHIDTVLRNAAAWVEAQKVEGLTLEIVRLEGRTPVLFFEVAATRPLAESAQTVLMYGHLDKQPEFNGWRNDLGPWTPKYEDGKLYGRGAADDGYAVYASIAAVQALKAQKVPHPRIVGLIETCEESGSYDLLPYVDALRPRLGDVGLVICLDSGAIHCSSGTASGSTSGGAFITPSSGEANTAASTMQMPPIQLLAPQAARAAPSAASRLLAPSACATTTPTPAPMMRKNTNSIASTWLTRAKAAPCASPRRAASTVPTRPMPMASAISANSGTASGSSRGAGGGGRGSSRRAWRAVKRGRGGAARPRAAGGCGRCRSTCRRRRRRRSASRSRRGR